ncbi:hypothetical protein ADL21_00810 [Streptomyces albus subsp. albus]|nr:hypothetical protein ADL21_00810 [Streptomyces albus subsp. albus]
MTDRADMLPPPPSDRRGWRSWELHVPVFDRDVMDQVIREVVAPCAAEISGGGTVRWFYLRYWQRGPHIRVRMRDLPDTDARTVQRDFSRRLATVNSAVPRHRWLTPAAYRTYAAPLARAGELGRSLSVSDLVAPGVRHGHYEPEYSRYGGREAMDDAEVSFRDSSELAVGLLARRPGQAARCGLGLFAAAGLFRLMTDTPADTADVLNSLWAMWRRWTGGEESERGTVAGAATADHSPSGLIAALSQEVGTEVAALRRNGTAERLLQGELPPPLQGWARSLTDTLRQRPTGDTGAVLASHLHMLSNRIGLSTRDEMRNLAMLTLLFADGTR